MLYQRSDFDNLMGKRILCGVFVGEQRVAYERTKARIDFVTSHGKPYFFQLLNMIFFPFHAT